MRFAVALVLAVAPVLVVGCGSSAAGPDGDVGSSADEAALSTHMGTCNRTKVLASVTGARRTVLTRGFGWLDANVPYSQSGSHGGYRTDCSGFVSMCWQKDRSYTTSDYVSGGGDTASIGSYDKLLPGDALVRSGHIMLFTGWADAAHTGVCALEQASTASDMQFRVRTVSSLKSQGYKAIRTDDLSGVTSAPAPAPAPAPAETEDPPVDDPTPAPVDDPADPADRPVDDLPPVADPPPPDVTTPAPDESGGVVVTGDTNQTATPSDQPVEGAAGGNAASSSAAKKKKADTSTTEGSGSQWRFSDTEDSGGCSVTPARAASPAKAPLASIALGLAALAFVRRRRR